MNHTYPRMYVYEHITATTPKGVDPALEKEGSAMLERLSATLAQSQNVPVTIFLHESRQGMLPERDVHYLPDSLPFANLLQEIDPAGLWHLVAPETDNILHRLLQQLRDQGISWWGPPLELVELFTDKLHSFQVLGDPIAETTDNPSALTGPSPFLVVKPRDGCGSMFVARAPKTLAQDLIDQTRAAGCLSPLVFQEWITGRAASIAVIGTGTTNPPTYLPLAEQSIVEIPAGPFMRLSYRGGRVPMNHPDANARAAVRSIIDRLPPFTGYLGFDLVINDKGEVHVIEINPRLSTTYAGYSRYFGAQDMGNILMGAPIPLPIPSHIIHFTADGTHERSDLP